LTGWKGVRKEEEQARRGKEGGEGGERAPSLSVVDQAAPGRFNWDRALRTDVRLSDLKETLFSFLSRLFLVFVVLTARPDRSATRPALAQSTRVIERLGKLPLRQRAAVRIGKGEKAFGVEQATDDVAST
jgi:hypothetical protein